MRAKPADLIVAIALTDLLQSGFLIANVIYYFSEPAPPKIEDNFCQVTGYFQIIITYNEILYNTSFAIFLILRIKYLFRSISIPNYVFHLAVLVLDACLVLEIRFFSQIGKTFSGLCGFKACSLESSLQLLGRFIVFSTVSAFSMWYFKRKVPKGDLEVMRLKSNFLDFYYFYIKMCLFGYIFNIFVSFLLFFNSFYWKSPKLKHLTTLYNIERFVITMCLSFIRLGDPFIRIKIVKVLTKVLGNRSGFLKKLCGDSLEINENRNLNAKLNENSANSEENSRESNINYMQKTIIWKNRNEIIVKSNRDLQEIEGESNAEMSKKIGSSTQNSKIIIELMNSEQRSDNFNMEMFPSSMIPDKKISVFEIDTNNKLKMAIMKKKELDGNFWLDLLGSNLRTNFTCSILTGILIAHQKFQQQLRSSSKTPLHSETLRSNSLFYKGKLKLLINECAEDSTNSKKLEMTVHAGHMFHLILQRDLSEISLETSLNIAKNFENIENLAKSDGGKSGELFFSSFDHKLLIKTVKKAELSQFRLHFLEYFRYLTETNPKTLITPIYGVYSFKRRDISQVAHVILMRNLLNSPKESIDSIYDLKGSSYDREVLKKTTSLSGKLTILKDLDFLKRQRKLSIQLNRLVLMEIIKKDAEFLRNCGFIDYSLLVIVCKSQKNQENCEKTQENQQKNMFFLQAAAENLVFHLGIIDYLQKYDIHKVLEKYAKKMLRMDLKLDTSAQDPKVYAERFVNFLDSIFTNP